uniref:Uncharacterized protein n=1 Tax=Pyrodinium bahamense TaxID=73915 RepID=A0A7S0AZ46_9DINO|mmetsp:Transcript_4530/g.12459  ORF Transcript_4530/g.12459 Transcript_4530/m.12459 type:complete len:170 (+) Transcript_4530:166-675(+)|eukprot:CAMPEP_0179060104 /NCGR_PEP_ID=MMETSP0796-20121207/25693_1 /TAXON_ID=73915 /ORGANISM="Pyrodinium bahamense, Strain pbaha01" /LENGTH=169 /DNA_ID=CAMNT_0020756875 /DNA_START=147 /DNA_END=656 /DNA_ORIENTATION=+
MGLVCCSEGDQQGRDMKDDSVPMGDERATAPMDDAVVLKAPDAAVVLTSRSSNGRAKDLGGSSGTDAPTTSRSASGNLEEARILKMAVDPAPAGAETANGCPTGDAEERAPGAEEPALEVLQADADPDLEGFELGNVYLSSTPARERETASSFQQDLVSSLVTKPARNR